MQPKEPNIDQIITLINGHLSGTLSASEAHTLANWIAADVTNAKLFAQLNDLAYRKKELREMGSFTNEETALANFLEKATGNMPDTHKIRPLWQRIAAVASIAIALSAGSWFYNTYDLNNRHPRAGQETGSIAKNDIAPGKNTATLTLSDGKTVLLSDAQTGVVIDAASLRYNDGSVVENKDQGRAINALLTATTPKGGTYQITLSDGTKVWLNAASSIRFPAKFIGNERKVELTGEAYFEVAKFSGAVKGSSSAKHLPFLVLSKGQEVTVLGTHFNISSYADESSVKTTLLEGSVRVSSLPGGSRKTSVGMSGAGEAVVLKPGQQAVLNASNQLDVKAVNAADFVAWKNGEFIFNDESIGSIMRRIARWYDVEIIYEGVNPEETFWGSISRFENVSKVLENLELTGGIHFEIKGRKIIVRK